MDNDIKVITGYPPNYQQLRTLFPVTDRQIFAYYPNIYKSVEDELTPDLLLHENIHIEVQKKMGVEIWWYQYLTDKSFRLEQEIMAFAAQYNLCKIIYAPRISKDMLHEFATNLSSPLYGGIVEKSKAETLIRIKAKQYEVQKGE